MSGIQAEQVPLRCNTKHVQQKRIDGCNRLELAWQPY